MTKLLRSALCTTILLLSTITSASAQEASSFAQQLPDRVAAWLHVSDAETLRARFAGSAWGRLLGDPAVADFRADLVAKLARNSAIPMTDLLGGLSGEVGIALMQPQGGRTDFAASLGFAEQATLDRLVKSITDRATSSKPAKVVKETTHNATTITLILAKADDPPEAAEQAFAVRGQRIVASNSTTLLRQILDREGAGATGSFAANERLKAISTATQDGDREPAVRWFLDPVGFLQNVVPPQIATTLKAQELQRLQAIGGSIDFATGTYDTISRTVGLVESPVSGILGLMKFPVDQLSIPGWVPNNVSGCLAVNWDAESGWLAIKGLADELIGPGKIDRAVESLATDSNGPMIHIGNDLFGQLTGRLIVIQSPPQSDTEFKEGATLLSADVKNAAMAATIFGRLADLDSDKIEKQTVAGQTALSYTGRSGRTVHLALSGGRLLVSESEELLVQIMTPNPANITLVLSDDYARLSKKLPGRSSLVGIQRSTEQLQAIYAVLKASDSRGDSAPDLKLLPPFEQIRHHFLPTATYATVAPTVSGFQYVSFTLAPNAEAE